MLDLKRIIVILVIIILIISVIGGIYFIINKNQNNDNNILEYTPQEEISEEQMRSTLLSLYFINGDELVPEARLIDVKELIDDPYKEILQMLCNGPKSENMKKTIPDGTKINKILKDGENLIIDFSKEFIENHQGGEREEKYTIDSIVNSLTELTEINGIKILIDGEENKSFKDEFIKFDKIFTR